MKIENMRDYVYYNLTEIVKGYWIKGWTEEWRNAPREKILKPLRQLEAIETFLRVMTEADARELLKNHDPKRFSDMSDAGVADLVDFINTSGGIQNLRREGNGLMRAAFDIVRNNPGYWPQGPDGPIRPDGGKSSITEKE